MIWWPIKKVAIDEQRKKKEVAVEDVVAHDDAFNARLDDNDEFEKKIDQVVADLVVAPLVGPLTKKRRMPRRKKSPEAP